MLIMAIVILAFSLSPERRRALPRLTPRQAAEQQEQRRASLAENGWEERVLYNLTQAEPSWE